MKLSKGKIIKKYSKDIGCFIIIDYQILQETRKVIGKLVSITEEGKLEIRHVKDSIQRWEIDPNCIINYSVRPLRKGGKV